MKTKKIILTSILLLQVLGLNNIISAEEQTSTQKREVIVSEIIPGGDCKCAIKDEKSELWYRPIEAQKWEACRKEVYERVYICSHDPGLKWFQFVFARIIRWIVEISLLLGVLAFSAFGVAWAVAGPDDPSYKKFLKDWIINLIIGLVLLFMFRYILAFLAPWVYQ